MDLLLNKRVFFVLLIRLTGSVEGLSENVRWTLCVTKCFHLGPSTITFSEVNSYCGHLSPLAKPVDFGMKGNDSISMELGSCSLNKREGDYYWINKKYSTCSNCRTIKFNGSLLLEDQDFLCSTTAHPFCEADKSLCENIVQGQTDAEWGAVDNTPPYYHVSTTTFSYCDAVTYCENIQTHLAPIDTGDYTFLTKLWTVLKGRAGDNFVVWIFTSGIRCSAGVTLQASAISYFGALAHMPGNKSTTEHHLALCSSPFIPTTTTSTTTTATSTTSTPTTTSTTPAISTTEKRPTLISTTSTSFSTTRRTTTETTTVATIEPPKTTKGTSTTSATTAAPGTVLTITTDSKTMNVKTTGEHRSATHQISQSSTKSLSSPRSTTTSPRSATTSPNSTTLLMHAGMKNQMAVSQDREPLWLQTGDHEYFINYDCIKKKCPVSCSSAKLRDGKSFCDSDIESFQVLPAPETYNGNDFWIGGRVTNTDMLCDETIQFEKYVQRPVHPKLSKSKVQELWQELRKQRRSRRMSKIEL